MGSVSLKAEKSEAIRLCKQRRKFKERRKVIKQAIDSSRHHRRQPFQSSVTVGKIRAPRGKGRLEKTCHHPKPQFKAHRRNCDFTSRCSPPSQPPAESPSCSPAAVPSSLPSRTAISFVRVLLDRRSSSSSPVRHRLSRRKATAAQSHRVSLLLASRSSLADLSTADPSIAGQTITAELTAAPAKLAVAVSPPSEHCRSSSTTHLAHCDATGCGDCARSNAFCCGCGFPKTNEEDEQGNS